MSCGAEQQFDILLEHFHLFCFHQGNNITNSNTEHVASRIDFFMVHKMFFSLYLIFIKLEGNLDWNLNEVLYHKHMTVFCLDPGTLLSGSFKNHESL